MELEIIKGKYPIGAHVKLIKMAGEPQMERGLNGTISGIDDIGQIRVHWENGSSLALNCDVDKFELVEEGKIAVLVIEPDTAPRTEKIANTLPAMQKVVGGRIEMFSPFNDAVSIVCHEEGKVIALPINREVWIDNTKIDVICGTFFICATPSEDGENKSLTKEQIEKYSKLFEI